jgi:hypothetical protein
MELQERTDLDRDAPTLSGIGHPCFKAHCILCLGGTSGEQAMTDRRASDGVAAKTFEGDDP